MLYLFWNLKYNQSIATFWYFCSVALATHNTRLTEKSRCRLFATLFSRLGAPRSRPLRFVPWAWRTLLRIDVSSSATSPIHCFCTFLPLWYRLWTWSHHNRIFCWRTTRPRTLTRLFSQQFRIRTFYHSSIRLRTFLLCSRPYVHPA